VQFSIARNGQFTFASNIVYFTPDSAGTCYVEAEALHSGVGSYRLSVTEAEFADEEGLTLSVSDACAANRCGIRRDDRDCAADREGVTIGTTLKARLASMSAIAPIRPPNRAPLRPPTVPVSERTPLSMPRRNHSPDTFPNVNNALR